MTEPKLKCGDCKTLATTILYAGQSEMLRRNLKSAGMRWRAVDSALNGAFPFNPNTVQRSVNPLCVSGYGLSKNVFRVY